MVLEKTILMYAVEREDGDFVEWLIERNGADINAVDKTGKTVLMREVEKCNKDTVDLIVNCDCRG